MGKLLVSNNEYCHDGWVSDKMAFIGAIMGDIIGSAYELKGTRIKTIDFELFSENSTFTDDTVMTIAVAKWLSDIYSIPVDGDRLIPIMQELGNNYMQVGYGARFKQWLQSKKPLPYNSMGNGSAMRVAAAGLWGQSLQECQLIARISASVSHNHSEGIKGAEAVASAIRLAKCHRTKECIKAYIETKYAYNLSRDLDDIRATYEFDPTCPGSVPEAIICFLESKDVESAIRLAVSLGGDADTQACIAGAIAGAYYGSVPKVFLNKFYQMLPAEFIDILHKFLNLNNDLDKTLLFNDYRELNLILQDRFPTIVQCRYDEHKIKG